MPQTDIDLETHLAGSSMPDDRPVERLDVRELPPPEPLRETLERVVDLDERVLVQISDRVPQHLFPRLDERGFAYETVETDSLVLTAIWVPDPE